MAPWRCGGYHYCTISFNYTWTQALRRFKPCSRRVRNSLWWGSPTMVPARNKAKRLSSVNHTTKATHHHQGSSFKSNNELLNSSVPIREDSFVPINLQSILFRVFRRVILLSWNIGQRRKKLDVDSISISQLHRGSLQFWKLWLNLCSRRWLSPRRSRVINLIPLWL